MSRIDATIIYSGGEPLMAPITKEDILSKLTAKMKENEEVIGEQMRQIETLEKEKRELDDKVAELQLRVEELEGQVKEGEELKAQLAQILGN